MHPCRVLAPSVLVFCLSVVAAQEIDPEQLQAVQVSPQRIDPQSIGAPQTDAGPGDADDLTPVVSPSMRDGLDLITAPMPARRESRSAASRSTEQTPSPEHTSVLTNDAIISMVDARFSSATIVAAMTVNETAFDLSPRGLLALKNADVPDRVIEGMIRIEADKRAAAEAAAAEAAVAAASAAAAAESAAAATATAEAATAQATAPGTGALARADEPAIREPAKDLPSGPGPHAWIAAESDPVVLVSTTAEVALTDTKGRGSTALSALRGIGEKALAFATPALGIASELELDGLFRNSDPKITAVWALPGTSAARRFAADTVFEIDFNNIPGINPDDYRPKIVELVPTRDNYRLVGAARARLSEIDEGLPAEPIIEEPAASEIRPLSRGRYRITLDPDLPTGEYALVLRPVDRPRSKREDDTSLSALMGASGSEILFITWDFSVRS